MSKNVVLCLDGTANEPEREHTNVARTFDMLIRQPGAQVAYYDPGVGTMGARSASSRLGQFLTRVGGLAFGHGIRENIAEAYEFLCDNYEPGDRLFVFGFSRGAYTARALVGLLRTTGLLEPSATNLIPYALKLYTRAQRSSDERNDDKFWRDVQRWEATFGAPGFERFARPVHFLGVWDTVKFVGWLNLRGRFQQVRWPFTRNVDGVAHGRHAVSIDERRRYYAEYLFDARALAREDRDLREVWFAGYHSDVGGGFEDHRLADIALKWIIDEAVRLGLQVDSRRYRRHLGVDPGESLPATISSGPDHPAGMGWLLAGFGWRSRKVPDGAQVHRSVERRMGDADLSYRPRLLGPRYVDE